MYKTSHTKNDMSVLYKYFNFLSLLDGTLRFYAGRTYFGILQIYHNGKWGYKCDDGWYREESTVACKQLGFSDYSYYRRGKITSGFYWLDNVVCAGNEQKIINCQSNGWGIHNCGSSDEGIYLKCTGGNIME